MRDTEVKGAVVSVATALLLLDPRWEDCLYSVNVNAGTTSGGVRVSLDGGMTWGDYAVGWASSLMVVPK